VVLYLFIIGFISILGQVVILRELNVAFYGIELIYLLGIGIWLFGTAIGALIGRKSFIPSTFQILILFITFAVLLLPDIIFIRSIRILFAPAPGVFLPFLIQIGTMSIAVLPVSFILGLLFQWAAKQYVTLGYTLAKAYAIESAGGLIGGLASTILLKFGVQNLSIVIFCVLISLGTSLFYRNKIRLPFYRYGVICIIGLFSLVLIKTSSIDTRLTTWNHPQLVETMDTPYSRVTIRKLVGQISVFENDALSFETESTAAEEFIHLVTLQHAKPEEVLILGGGIEGLCRELLYHPIQNVTYVELNKSLIEMASLYLPADINQSLKNERVQLFIDDPRHFLHKQNSYDIILVGMPEPTSGQANRFYTQEFFEQCSARLNSGGILAFTIRSSENLWTPQLTRRNGSIYRALESVFHDIVILPGVTNTFIASHSTLVRNPTVLIERFLSRSIKARLITSPYINYLYTNDRFLQINQILKESEAPLNTDVKPVCYQYTIALWLSKFFPSLTRADFTLFKEKEKKPIRLYWILFLTSIPVILVFRFWRFSRRVLLMGFAGFLGMVMETLFILHYQVKSGILFQDIGILLMSFMAGLSLGSFSINKLAYFLSGKYKISRWVGFCLLLSFGLLGVSFNFVLYSEIFSEIIGAALFLLIDGFLVAGIFAYTSLSNVKNQRFVVSPLYSADLIGGCIGSLVATIVLIPMIGLGITSILMAILAMVSILLL